MPKNAPERVAAKIVYSGPVPAPVKQGQPIGNLQVYRGERVAAEFPLVAAENVEPGNLFRRAFDAASELVIGLFRMAPLKM
jgi:serine-type D-Ala-D-Ala carboxypeptidase (penicillin-binding protein 5/6)